MRTAATRWPCSLPITLAALVAPGQRRRTQWRRSQVPAIPPGRRPGMNRRTAGACFSMSGSFSAESPQSRGACEAGPCNALKKPPCRSRTARSCRGPVIKIRPVTSGRAVRPRLWHSIRSWAPRRHGHHHDPGAGQHRIERPGELPGRPGSGTGTGSAAPPGPTVGSGPAAPSMSRPGPQSRPGYERDGCPPRSRTDTYKRRGVTAPLWRPGNRPHRGAGRSCNCIGAGTSAVAKAGQLDRDRRTRVPLWQGMAKARRDASWWVRKRLYRPPSPSVATASSSIRSGTATASEAPCGQPSPCC